jgi:hypothetical protein
MRPKDAFFMYAQDSVGKISVMYFIYLIVNLFLKVVIRLFPTRYTEDAMTACQWDCKIWRKWEMWAAAYPPAFYFTIVFYTIA